MRAKSLAEQDLKELMTELLSCLDEFKRATRSLEYEKTQSVKERMEEISTELAKRREARIRSNLSGT